MKKCLITLAAIALLVCVIIIPTGGAAFADTQDGYKVREGYLAEITYGNFSMAGGSIIRSFTFTFDKEFLDTLNPDAIFGKEELYDYITAFIVSIGYTARTDEKGRIIGSKTFDSATDLYIEEYQIDGYEKDDSKYERKDGFFYSDIFFNQKTVFDGIEGDNIAMGMLLNILYMFDLEREDIALSYHYGTPYKIITTDAERSYFDTNSNIYVHEFYMNVANADREIKLTQHVPNVTNWYLLAIACSLPVVLVTLAAMAISRARKKRRGYAD